MLTRTLVPLALAASVALAGCSQENDDRATDANAGSSPSASESTGASESGSPSASATEAGTSCAYPSDGSSPAKDAEAPSESATEPASVPATITLGQGELRATLDAGGAPCTVHSFVSLAEQGYFDGTGCHRLTTQGIYVLQCGDPSGTGMGGPGYSFDDELGTAEKLEAGPQGSVLYPPGTLAMANAGPNTNGSQFFVVYGDSPLAPSYTVFGRIDAASLKTVQKIARAGTDTGGPDGAPKQPVTIEKVTVG